MRHVQNIFKHITHNRAHIRCEHAVGEGKLGVLSLPNMEAPKVFLDPLHNKCYLVKDWLAEDFDFFRTDHKLLLLCC